MEINFDERIERLDTCCIKWDSMPRRDIVPLWVADMDFKAAPCIVDAVTACAADGVYGYTRPDAKYYRAINEWFRTHHGFKVDCDSVITVNAVVPALSAIISALGKNSGVIVQPPVYNCFLSLPRMNGCHLLCNDLIRVNDEEGSFSYRMDYEGLEALAARVDASMLLLCNPHNPAGRLWRRDELERVRDICSKYNVIVVSDEVHCELTAPDTLYTPYRTIDENSIVCLSPSKSFNIAGVLNAVISCPDATLRERIRDTVTCRGIGEMNPFGVAALKAAYSDEGWEWLTHLREYIWDNYLFMKKYIRSRMPELTVSRLEATYLAWIDVSLIFASTLELENRLKMEAGVWVNSGEMYGKGGYLRVNLATRRELLTEGLERLVSYLSGLH